MEAYSYIYGVKIESVNFNQGKKVRITERYRRVLNYFSEVMPAPETELEYNNPFQLLVAVILSAQCTDKRVNKITPHLFNRFPDAASMANAGEDEILKLIGSCSYPNSKARHLAGMARMLTNDFNGQVPEERDELQKLPGVGRKTANVIASVVFRKPYMPVDTHVFRVSARLGLAGNAKTPLETETRLVKHIPEEMIADAHHWLILHGRYTCLARNPKCDKCGLSEICQFFNKKSK